MTYRDLLLDPRWLALSGAIKQRDNWTCRKCGRFDVVLHVHHTLYLPGRAPWEYPEEVLVTVCEHCHKTIHGFDLLPKDPAWFWSPNIDPPLPCVLCGAYLQAIDVAGRMEKHEPLCEPCALKLEEDHFSRS